MRIHKLSKEAKERKAYDWHRHFAWKPVRVDNETIIWLEFYMRRNDYGGWKYLTIEEAVRERLLGTENGRI